MTHKHPHPTRRLATISALTALLIAPLGVATAQSTPVEVAGLIELSGPSATVGSNFDRGIRLAVKEINASGGFAGRQINYTPLDTQSQPGVAKGLAKKVVDQGAQLVLGPVASSEILVSMVETQRAEVPNFVGGEAAGITQQNNGYVFRTSFTQSASMPKVARYIKDSVKASTVAIIYVNNDFGKGGRDAIIKAFQADGIKVAADISTDFGQIDFSSAVLSAKRANADALFVYVHEEEAARVLRELRKQGYDKPIIGESTLANDKVIELAGAAANGIIGHVHLTPIAPGAQVQKFSRDFLAAYKVTPDSNAMKGYTAVYIAKAVADRQGKVDPKAMAAGLHGAQLTVKEQPGILMDVSYDAKGDLERESFIVKVVDGKQQVIETLKPMAVGK